MALFINGTEVNSRTGFVHYGSANDIDRVFFNNVKVWEKVRSLPDISVKATLNWAKIVKHGIAGAFYGIGDDDRLAGLITIGDFAIGDIKLNESYDEKGAYFLLSGWPQEYLGAQITFTFKWKSNPPLSLNSLMDSSDSSHTTWYHTGVGNPVILTKNGIISDNQIKFNFDDFGDKKYSVAQPCIGDKIIANGYVLSENGEVSTFKEWKQFLLDAGQLTEDEDEDEPFFEVCPELFLQVEINITKNGMKARGVGNFKMGADENFYYYYGRLEENYINIIHTN